jgi:DNA-binding MarR family transcriptional regulator
VLYFLARRPGIAVAALLAILGVTKQSLGRVTVELATKGLIEQRPGEKDRRQRLYQLTPAGIELEAEIYADLHANVLRAYTASGGEAVAGFWTVMQHLIGEEGNEQFRVVQGL